MGQIILKALYSFQSQKEKKILMLGIDDAGKTTILYQLKLNKAIQLIPTVGFTVEKIIYKNLELQFWDLSGNDYSRKFFWHHYYKNSNALLFVIDSSNIERFSEAKQTLNMLLENPNIPDIPILILANKQDIAAVNTERLQEQLELNQYIGVRQLHIQGCCALNGDGLKEGLNWLSNILIKQKF
ncbi:ADP-ribosylation factor(Arf)/Arf-like (Arl) small GTPase family protein (macronuclear) [Tetrahymena thermophila SB210]|uniref:ADP-ribosylation factor(Arf)/Arf-like (Arl) small GTPase family protein n=1 Tax=Tetrahymena thermophila (strain SB210) TaxID=312017 RepID=W7XKA5_TETTS|nr:ADP-ribosylation factor(Arf)/Arf-like (Arl) small GTPase family protein [Tetrahymena thermophila SB210]EWS74759.1 ADP-ribosylation factor(Arf)/Arf-like (Arl) small GTPase family protein [Tetrahymena thermophila SB210]|eukprot:XP_012652760.1 ADP-ribosylation factor(Arf)/Arf-like (Arl) small GTPase family protein [Tetrahymena thermophila SB210]